jgi:hypothetical protein
MALNSDSTTAGGIVCSSFPRISRNHRLDHLVLLAREDECHAVHFLQTFLDQERVQFDPLRISRLSLSSTSRKLFTKSSTFSRNSSSSHGSVIDRGFAIGAAWRFIA